MNTIPELKTSVGHASLLEHRYCSRAVFADIATKEQFWSVLSISCGGPPLNAEQNELVDISSRVCLAADPRIWPMKLIRLLSAYGGSTAAIGACFELFGSAFIGPAFISAASNFLASLDEEIKHSDRPRAEVILNRIRAHRDVHRAIPGFGTPFRQEDERLVAMCQAVKERGYDQGKFWKLAWEIQEIMSSYVSNSNINICAALGGLYLDMGLRTEHVYGISLGLCLGPMIANAVEGAQQSPELLQELPQDWIQYRGPDKRKSPRAQLAESATKP